MEPGGAGALAHGGKAGALELTGAVAVFGATSGIARCVIEALLKRGEAVVLIGRSLPALEALAADLEVAAGRRPPVFAWDALDFAGHGARFAALRGAHALKGLVMAAGVLFPQAECEADPAKALLTYQSNLVGPALVMDLFAAHFRERAGGFICGISSVAGDRGRGKVLAYAASKAGLSAYLDGLRHRLAGTGVLVQTVKPGFVRTRMTAGQASPLVAAPERVGADIVAALDRRQATVYTPWFWRHIMGIIRLIPEPLFRRLKF